jgi:hypothetical protein
MATWQFWTLLGVICGFGIYIVASLSALIDSVETANKWLAMCHEHQRSMVGVLASTSIDIEAIKHRAQRD